MLTPEPESNEENDDSEAEDGNSEKDDVIPNVLHDQVPSSDLPNLDEGDEDEDEDESDFIEDDGPNRAELPMEFSKNSYNSLFENFRILCQLLVHVACQEPHERYHYMANLLKGDH